MPVEMNSIYPDREVLFIVTVVSDAMRRGVRHFRTDGTPLANVNAVMDALAADGEVLIDADACDAVVSH